MPVKQDLSKYKTPEGFRGRSKYFVLTWWIIYALFFRPSLQPFYGWRRFLLRCFGAKIGKKVLIRPTARITYPWKVKIGNYSWIGDEVQLYSLGEISIGDHTVISQRSYICTGTHDYNSESFDIYAHPINIGDHCWIATDVFVSPGITIGDGAVVGARSTVVKNIAPNTINIGSPSKEIKNR